jgi:hypothetical protein
MHNAEQQVKTKPMGSGSQRISHFGGLVVLVVNKFLHVATSWRR